MRKITLKMVLMLGVLAVLIVSVAGCTSSTSSTQTAGSTSKAASTTATTANVRTAPTAQQTVVKEITKVIVVPAPAPTPQRHPAAPPVPPVPLPTTMEISATPDLNQPGGYVGTYTLYSTPLKNMGWITVYEYVNGVFVGTETPTLYSNMNYIGGPQFPTNLPKGTHYSLTIVFPGNADYAQSSVTGYFIMPY